MDLRLTYRQGCSNQICMIRLVSVFFMHACFKGTLEPHGNPAHMQLANQLHITTQCYVQQNVVPDCQCQHQQLRLGAHCEASTDCQSAHFHQSFWRKEAQ